MNRPLAGPMRALQLSKFYPPVMGGIESVAWELVEGLNHRGVPTDVLCANQQPHTAREQAASGYRIWRSASWGMLLSTSMAPSMGWHLHQMAQGCSIVHLHMPDPAAALALWLARPRARLVVHWHSDVIRQRLAMHLYAPLQNWVLARADAIIATSEPYARASEALQPWRRKVHVVPIGISDNAAAVDATAMAAVRRQVRQRRIVFALGRMTYYKGFEVLIEAAARLPEDTVVVIGGDGEMLAQYKSLTARLGLAGKVQFPGHIADPDLPNWFAACDVFCMPSTVRAEAYGVAMLEAMVMARPIVASDIEGSAVPWVNQHGVTGFNFPVRDSQALADTLCRLLDDPPLSRRLGEAARERYLSSFTAERMTQQTIELYRSLVEPGRHAPTPD